MFCPPTAETSVTSTMRVFGVKALPPVRTCFETSLLTRVYKSPVAGSNTMSRQPVAVGVRLMMAPVALV